MKSMTGYGRAQEVLDGRDITVEIKAVNHRFFEFSYRGPRAYGYLEDKLKTLTQKYVSRGKIDLSVTIYSLQKSDGIVEIDENLAEKYIDALRGISEKFNLNDDLSLSSISRFNDIFILRKEVPDEEIIFTLVKQVAEKSLEKFLSMRKVEGEKLKQDLENRLNIISEYVDFVEEKSPVTVENYRNKLYLKLQEVINNTSIDESRILTEAAIFAEKVAVAEETVRLKSHISQFRELIEQDIPLGRKFDFLVQEMNREVNTIGSKAQDVDISKIVVEMKSEIEKIREQVQNIE